VQTDLDYLVPSDVCPGGIGDQGIQWEASERHLGTVGLNIALNRECSWLRRNVADVGWIFDRFASREIRDLI
jgi:hypothetical protein